MFFAIVVLLGAAAPAIQSKPDFSGEWVLNRQASTLSPGADRMESGVMRIEHREPVFRNTTTLVAADSRPISFTYELRSDGGEVSAAQGPPSVTSLRWDGDALIFTSQTPGGKGLKISFRYELIDGGRRIRATEQLRGTDHDQDNVWIFDRRGEPR